MFVIALFIQMVGVALPAVKVIDCAWAVIVPVAVVALHTPEVVIVKANVPAAEGVPLIVNTFPLLVIATPVGNPVIVALVALPPIVKTIFDMALLLQTVCALEPEVRAIVWACTFIVPLAVIELQLPTVVTLYV